MRNDGERRIVDATTEVSAAIEPRDESSVELPRDVADPRLATLRAYRLGRLRAELAKQDYAGIVLYDPINIRYATGSRNMAVWTMHNAVRYCYVPTEGPVTLFELHNCEHLSEGLETIADVRPAVSWCFFAVGPGLHEAASRWAAEIADLVGRHGGGNRRLALDSCAPAGIQALSALGIEVREGQGCCELARAIKSDIEVLLIKQAIAVCHSAMYEMRDALRPGMTENELWSILNQVNCAKGGEWIETRLLTSGTRTNPWYQEASGSEIRAGELVSFDTDLIGPQGYCADISRTYHCGSGKPTPEQQRLYRLAHDQIQHNLDLLQPYMTFQEIADRAWKLPESCAPNRYSEVIHGVGLCDEYPTVYFAEDYAKGEGYDGMIDPGMTLCIESYMGEVGGHEGVKLEQQVLVHEKGVELLSNFPFEEALLLPEL